MLELPRGHWLSLANGLWAQVTYVTSGRSFKPESSTHGLFLTTAVPKLKMCSKKTFLSPGLCDIQKAETLPMYVEQVK